MSEFTVISNRKDEDWGWSVWSHNIKASSPKEAVEKAQRHGANFRPGDRVIAVSRSVNTVSEFKGVAPTGVTFEEVEPQTRNVW